LSDQNQLFYSHFLKSNRISQDVCLRPADPTAFDQRNTAERAIPAASVGDFQICGGSLNRRLARQNFFGNRIKLNIRFFDTGYQLKNVSDFSGSQNTIYFGTSLQNLPAIKFSHATDRQQELPRFFVGGQSLYRFDGFFTSGLNKPAGINNQIFGLFGIDIK